MKDQICVLDKRDKTPKSAILQTNEDATLYFMEIKSTRKMMPKKKRTIAKLKSNLKTELDVYYKKYERSYTGCLF